MNPVKVLVPRSIRVPVCNHHIINIIVNRVFFYHHQVESRWNHALILLSRSKNFFICTEYYYYIMYVIAAHTNLVIIVNWGHRDEPHFHKLIVLICIDYNFRCSSINDWCLFCFLVYFNMEMILSLYDTEPLGSNGGCAGEIARVIYWQVSANGRVESWEANEFLEHLKPLFIVWG